MVKKEDGKRLSFFAQWSKFFITNSKITILLILTLIIGGTFGLYSLNREGWPQIPIPITIINTTFPGATSSDVEKKVTKPIESAASTLEQVKSIKSSSSNSFSQVEIEFEVGVDIDRKIQELDAALSRLDLPEEADDPEIIEVNTGPEILIAVAGDYNYADLREYAKDIKEEIESEVAGISEISIDGGSEREVQVIVDLKKLNQIGISLNDLKEVIASRNVSIPGGTIKNEKKEFTIETSHEIKSLDEIENMVIAQLGPSRSIKVKDVAEVERNAENPESTYRSGYKKNGKIYSDNSVYLFLRKKKGADISEISKQVKDVLKDLKKEKGIPKDLETFLALDDTEFLSRQIHDLVTSGWQGLIVIFLVLLIFISFRSSVVISLIIPIVLFSVFTLFRLFDLTLNTITLFSIILTLGILVDNAIVIVEAIQNQKNLGRTGLDAVVEAMNEVGTAVFSATLTTIIVFIPMIFIGGIIGEFIKYIPYTVITAIASSFFIGITITPFLGKKAIKPTEEVQEGKVKSIKEIKYWWIINLYERFMKRVLGSSVLIVTIFLMTLILFALSMSIPLTGKLPMEQFPSEDSEIFMVSMTFDKGTPFSEKNNKTKEVEEKIKELPHFVNYISFTQGSDNITVQVKITDPRKRKLTAFEISDKLEQKIENIKGVDIRVLQAGVGPPPAEYPIGVEINEDDLEKAKSAAEDVGEYLKGLEETTLVKNGVEGEEVPQVRVNFDKDKMEKLGIVPIQAATEIRSVYNPVDVTKVKLKGTEEAADLKILVEEKFKNSIDDLKNLSVTSMNGKKHKISEIAAVQEISELETINRYDRKRYIQVGAVLKDDVAPTDVEKKIKDYFDEEKLEDLGLNKNALTFRGQAEMDVEALDKIYFLLTLAIIFVYIILVAQFNSFLQPFIILFAIPLAIIGVFPGLLITGNILSFLANLGIVALVGIVVNDAIVFVNYFNQLRNKGFDFKGALIQAGKVRFKPIFSTSLTTIGGLLPLTIQLSYWRPIGTTVISGLLFSTIGTLVVIPISYTLAHTIFSFVKRIFVKA